VTLILVLSPTLFFFSLLFITSRYERRDLAWQSWDTSADEQSSRRSPGDAFSPRSEP